MSENKLKNFSFSTFFSFSYFMVMKVEKAFSKIKQTKKRDESHAEKNGKKCSRKMYKIERSMPNKLGMNRNYETQKKCCEGKT